jgi:hypothetical protein
VCPSVRQSVCLPACMEKLGFCYMDFHNILYLRIFLKYIKKIQESLNLTRIRGTLHENLCTFVTIFRWKNQNTHFTFNDFFFSGNRGVHNTEKYCRPREATHDNIIRRMHIAYWINKTIDTHSEYVILIHFLRQQWLRERASVLSYTNIAGLTIFLTLSRTTQCRKQ